MNVTFRLNLTGRIQNATARLIIGKIGESLAAREQVWHVFDPEVASPMGRGALENEQQASARFQPSQANGM